MKKKVGTFKIWLLAIAAVVAFSVLPKVSSLATEDQALVVKENMQEAADAAGDESSAENKQETAGEGANLEAQGLEIPVSKVKVSETIKHRLAYTVSYNHDTRQPNWVAWVLTGEHASGKLPRGKFADDEEMPAPVGTLADYYNPKIVSIRQHHKDLAVRSVELLFNMIDLNKPATHEIIPFELTVGESVKKIL